MFHTIVRLLFCVLLTGMRITAAENQEISHVELCHRLGEIAAQLAQIEGVPQDYTELVDCYRDAADRGYPEAQYHLGFMYWNGSHGLTQSTDKAVKWYRKAAERGYVEAQYTLGDAYDLGHHDFGPSVSENKVEAVRWYREAAEQGHPSAQYRLGRMYDDGEGVPEDDVQAYVWLNMAAAQGSEFAEERKQRVAESMTRAEVARAQDISREYWEKYVLPFRN